MSRSGFGAQILQFGIKVSVPSVQYCGQTLLFLFFSKVYNLV